MPTITDWLMVIITVIYVIATIMICLANIRSAKATREQLAEAKRQFEESNRALVTVSFEIIKSGLAVLHIQNIGKRVASTVNLKISSDFVSNIEDEFDRSHIEKLIESTFTLGVGQSWYICLGSNLDIERISKKLLLIDISYVDCKSKYNEKIAIDLKQYYWALMYESPTEDLYQEMKKLTKSVQSIDKSIKKLQKDLSTSKEGNTNA